LFPGAGNLTLYVVKIPATTDALHGNPCDSKPAHERRCRQEGFNGQLVKPVDICALDRLV